MSDAAHRCMALRDGKPCEREATDIRRFGLRIFIVCDKHYSSTFSGHTQEPVDLGALPGPLLAEYTAAVEALASELWQRWDELKRQACRAQGEATRAREALEAQSK
jgi:hypothetical protein